MHRRHFIELCAAGCILAVKGGQPLLAGTPNHRIVWVNLRGALDSLHTVLPIFDRNFRSYRGPFIAPIEQDLMALNDGYALHPSLKNLHAWYKEGAFVPVVAVASQYRERSHFEAQDILESGTLTAQTDRGWLAHALSLQGGKSIAIARSLPLILRGNASAQTWFPPKLRGADDDLIQRLLELYRNDSEFHVRLKNALDTRNQASAGMTGIHGATQFPALAEICGKLLANNAELACATLDFGGWDTHNQQIGRLDRQLKLLDAGLQKLRDSLGAAWADTLVIIGTEFGRTVAVNGTQGTDHGTASALLLCGGGVAGGKILGEWPGLARRELWQERDLRPTSDIRSWIGALLNAHWLLDKPAIAELFPGVELRKERLIR